ncbi:MAG: ASCH domain-containing protein [Oscillospiraceae bacterium]|nr:ASCH domain-containing protein [Oscillospiraceae bacterium]
MSKAVLMSIQPKWCQLIIIGKKTIEVRKSRPKLETTFKVYIYCTKDKKYSGVARGKVIGEFLCLAIEDYQYVRSDYIEEEGLLCSWACLDSYELHSYLKGAVPYVWYISRLVIYDTPKELSEFGKTRPPQSWCYVEETK